jgi:N-acetylmuramic acid 6-phosphate etherase
VSTESINPRFAELDLWPTGDAVAAMLEGQLAAAAAVQAQAGAIADAAAAAAARLANPTGRLAYAGAGTSGRLAILDGVELGPTFGWDEARTLFLLAGGTAAMTGAVEGAEDNGAAGEGAVAESALGPADVLVGVAASGRTPYTLAAIRAAAAAGALTIGIASNSGTPLLTAAPTRSCSTPGPRSSRAPPA